MAHDWLDLEFVNISQQKKIIERLEKTLHPLILTLLGTWEKCLAFFVLKYKEENQLVRAL